MYGVDFSGARDAGSRIWIARSTIEGTVLSVTDCFQAKELADSGKDRDRGLSALRAFIMRENESVFGMDFPFGIPKALHKEESWEKWVQAFRDLYSNPDEFRKVCRATSGGKELKRFTDRKVVTPFSPYNLRVYRQTYFGIRDVLGALLRENAICVLPMQKPLPGKAWVIEICPASTLRREGLSSPYKGGGERRRVARSGILRGLEDMGSLRIRGPALRSTIINDRGGDALDSVVAAFATFRALKCEFAFDKEAPYGLEGWVYA
jgi:hypothetical protein